MCEGEGGSSLNLILHLFSEIGIQAPSRQNENLLMKLD